MTVPPKLYKYESFNTQSLSNLKTGSIYFSLPNQFNDPFDCSLPVSLDLSLDSIEWFRTEFIKRGNLPILTCKQLEEIDKEKLLLLLENAMFEALADKLKGKGVSCFSSEYNNILMWSHYGAKHTGFCLEFDTKHEPFNKAKKVEYIDDFPKLNAEETIIDLNIEPILKLLHTKAKPWQYENEWRCIHYESPVVYTYPQESLTGVYFGSEMDLAAIEIICLIIQGQNPQVRFWRGKRHPERFSIAFDEFFYTPYIVAKQLGKL